MTNTFIKGVGRLTTDRYDFQNHIDGNPPHHKAGIITLDPAVVINSVSHTNVQDAIEELAPFAVTVPDATSTVKGIIKLSGDLSDSVDIDNIKCSASRIQGRTVLSTAPTTGQILLWGGTSWAPGTINEFEPGGDLDGDFLSQEVITITGTGTGPTDYVEMRCPIVLFTSSNPTVISMPNIAAAGNSMTIKAQNSSLLAGGNIAISSGYGAGGLGNVQLQLQPSDSSFSTLLELAEPTSNNYILSLVKGSTVTNTEMPNGTGNRVIYIANAASIPTVSPVGGVILYANAGQLVVKQSNGSTYVLNKTNAESLSRSYTQDQDEWKRYVYQLDGGSPIGGQESILTFSVPEDSTLLVEYTATGITTTDGYYSASKEIFTVNRNGSGSATQVGPTTTVHVQSNGISVAADFVVGSNTIIFRTGGDGVRAAYWSCHVEITIVKVI